MPSVDCTACEAPTRDLVERRRRSIEQSLKAVEPPEVLIVGEVDGKIRRTLKLLTALARGAWIVTEDWLDDARGAMKAENLSLYEHTRLPGARVARRAGGGRALAGLQVRIRGATELPIARLIRASRNPSYFGPTDSYRSHTRGR